jgi:hypothetical protein
VTRPGGLRPWLFAVGLLGLLGLHGFADPRPPEGVWGVVGMLAVPPWLRLAVCASAALLALPPVARAAVRACRPAGRRLAATLGRAPAGAWIAALVVAAWLLRSRTAYGDGGHIVWEIEHGQWIYYKEPLDRLAAALLYRAGNALFGWGAATAIAVLSTLAGALFWLALLRLARSRPLGEGGAVAIWGLLGTTGAAALFFGHVENYSLLTAGTLWTLVLLLEAALEPGRPLWPAGAAFGVTFATHLSAAWLAAALPVAWLVRHGGVSGLRVPERRRAARADALRACGAAALPFGLVVVGMTLAGLEPSGFSSATFGGGDGRMFVPLFAPETVYERFTMFSLPHVRFLANELLLVAPVGLLLAVVGALGRRADGRRSDAGTAVLLTAAAGTVTYAFVFNPDMMVASPLGGLNEWDLFALLAVPVTLLGLWWLRTAMDEGDERDALVLSATVVSVLHSLPWLLFNAGVRF